MSFGNSTMIREHLSNRGSSLAIGIAVVLFINGSAGQDIIFPDADDVPRVVTRLTTVTQPTTTTVLPALKEYKCPENMILVDAIETVSFCECVQGYLYYANLDKCYRQYTRGPCSQGSHFIIKPNATSAECISNPCRNDHEVMYKGKCYGLLVPDGPCRANESLVIPDNGYEPICDTIRTVSYQVITAPTKRCGPGSRRAGRGMCRTIL